VAANEHSTFVKICGIRRPQDAAAAFAAGANAIGFIFAPSPRRVTAAEAAEISLGIDPSVRSIGVFVDAAFGVVLETVEAAGLTGVQLQGSESQEFAEAIKRANPDLFVYKVLKIGALESLAAAEGLEPGGLDAVMVDRKDVDHPQRIVQPVPSEWLENLRIERLIVAGGLSPENIGPLVARLRPWGVDVSGGVEEALGKKDPGKIRAFVNAVRGAEAAA